MRTITRAEQWVALAEAGGTARRYKLEITTPDCDVIECGETVAPTQAAALDVAWERYRTLCESGDAVSYKRDRCNVVARPMRADP